MRIALTIKEVSPKQQIAAEEAIPEKLNPHTQCSPYVRLTILKSILCNFFRAYLTVGLILMIVHQRLKKQNEMPRLHIKHPISIPFNTCG